MLRQSKPKTGSPCVGNLAGRIRSAAEAAEAKATYLEMVLWACPEGQGTSLKCSPEEAACLTPEVLQGLRMAPEDESLDAIFEWGETSEGILRQEANKSVKPTRIPTELWKALADFIFSFLP